MRKLATVIVGCLVLGSLAAVLARRAGRLPSLRRRVPGARPNDSAADREAHLVPVPDLADGFTSFRQAMARVLLILTRTRETGGFGGREHSERVAHIAASLAPEMGLSHAETERLVLAALLHDIGKVAIPAEILQKPDALTEEEWRHIQAHPAVSEYLLAEIPALDDVAEILAQHHERYDGTGYPSGLAGDAIRVEARIFAVADAFAAMTSPRPYQCARSPEEALDELRRAAGSQFDPRVVARFTAVMPKVIEAGTGGIAAPLLPRRARSARRRAA
jgi:putative nucleotidyltransferase with HDIG domain